MTAAESPAVAGSFGPYRLIRELGEGGMGRVFQGEHTGIGRAVAIKLLNPEIAADPAMRARLFQEARIVNSIRHPHIVEVTDFGVADGQPYIVMEHLAGRTLAARIAQEGRLAEPTAVAIARQIASALSAVHERGIIHRDLKPDNVFLSDHVDYPDFVKVLDFGIAKQPHDVASAGHRTQTGTVVGTPAYMSPEQCMGDVALDFRTDIYALGVVLFQMVTGRVPFEGDGIGRVMVAHIQDPPPASGASPAMEVIIRRALAKQPGARFPSMREMRDALGAVLQPSAATAPTPPRLAAPAPALTATVLRTAVSRPSASRPTVPPAIAAPPPAPDPGLVQRCGERLAKIDVPAPSPVQAAVLDLAQSPAFSFPAAIALVRRDPRLATAVERMANLEPYGGRVAAAGLNQAISRVGAAGLVVAVVEQLARPVAEPSVGRAGALLRSPWRHALASAFLARRLAPVVRDPGEPAHAYLVALLAGIGCPLVARAIDELERQPDPLRSGQRRLWPEPAMLEAIAAHRDAMAERLARGWCLPTPVVDGLAGPRAAVASSRQARLCRLAGGLADLEGQFVRREDADSAPEIVAIEQVRLGVDEGTLVEARRRLRSWLAARL